MLISLFVRPLGREPSRRRWILPSLSIDGHGPGIEDVAIDHPRTRARIRDDQTANEILFQTLLNRRRGSERSSMDAMFECIAFHDFGREGSVPRQSVARAVAGSRGASVRGRGCVLGVGEA